jgi:hypothetical protein
VSDLTRVQPVSPNGLNTAAVRVDSIDLSSGLTSEAVLQCRVHGTAPDPLAPGRAADIVLSAAGVSYSPKLRRICRTFHDLREQPSGFAA